jgi:putative nucleotidyltransferase with HDIG domain
MMRGVNRGPKTNFEKYRELLRLLISNPAEFFNPQNRAKIVKFCLSFCFCLALSWFALYRFTPPVSLKVGEVAKVDVVAPFAFEVMDQTSTEEKRVRAESVIPLVYDFDPYVFDRLSKQIYTAFRMMRLRYREVVWPEQKIIRDKLQFEEKVRDFFVHKSAFEKELGTSVSDRMFEWLTVYRFSGRIESALIRNKDRWYQRKIAEAPDRFIPASQKEVLLRNIDLKIARDEIRLSKWEILDMQNQNYFVLEDKKGLEKMNEEDLELLLSLARSMMIPNLTLNKQETNIRKQNARESILPVTISVKKNQVLIARGSAIQAASLGLVDQMKLIQSERSRFLMTVSLAILLYLTSLTFGTYVRRFSNRIRFEMKDLAVMSIIAMLSILTVKIFELGYEMLFSQLRERFAPEDLMYASPIVLGPILVGLLIPTGEIVWLFTAFLAIVFGVMEGFDFTFSLVALVGGIAGARGVVRCQKRNDIYWAGLLTGAIMFGLLICLHLLDTSKATISIEDSVNKAVAGLIGGILSSLFAMILIPIFESLFRYTTDVKLLELSNLNHPLLKELLVKAPGTYHHSIMVGTLIESAAQEIGANPLLGKVMGYYHDIGKMNHPQYFIENQRPGHNPHDNISPFMSKTLLIAHVKDGAEYARQYRLGKPILDGILEHHGTTMMSFFYTKAMQQKKPTDVVTEQEFRYPGPKPQFKESGVLMLADGVEAASRTLDDPSPMRLQTLVKSIIQKKFNDGQLDDCNLSLKDLNLIEAIFVKILLGVYHHRIEYPDTAADVKVHSLENARTQYQKKNP